jgi:hypothetical protein
VNLVILTSLFSSLDSTRKVAINIEIGEDMRIAKNVINKDPIIAFRRPKLRVSFKNIEVSKAGRPLEISVHNILIRTIMLTIAVHQQNIVNI